MNNKLVINSKKCYMMLFTRSRIYAFPPDFSIGEVNVLQVKKTLRILGVFVQDDLSWQAQVEEMLRRATNTTWVLRRMKALGVSQKTLVEYWKSEGRVHFELACPVWHSGLTVPGPGRSPKSCHGCYNCQLEQLGLERLKPRREKLCRTFAEKTATSSRHTDMFTPSGSRLRKGKRSLIYRETISRTAPHSNSAVPNLTCLLNK